MPFYLPDIVHSIEINLTRKAMNDTATIVFKPLETLSFPNFKNDVEIYGSNDELLFSGYFYFPDAQLVRTRTPLPSPKCNIYTFIAESNFNDFKHKIIRNEEFYNWRGSDIIKYLIDKYAPEIKYNYMVETTPTDSENYEVLHFKFDSITLFDALIEISETCGYTIRVGYGRYGISQLIFEPLNSIDAVSILTIDDDHYISAEPFYYDFSKLYNKVRIIGGVQKKEQGFVYTTSDEHQRANDFQIWSGSETPYEISVSTSRRGELNISISEEQPEDCSQFDGWLDTTTNTLTLLEDLKVPDGSSKLAETLMVHFWVDIPIFIDLQDDQSINQYGVRESPDLIYDWITDYAMLNNIGKTYLRQYSQPQLNGQIIVDKDEISNYVFPNDKIYVNLSRYYTGYAYVDNVKHDIQSDHHYITIDIKPYDFWDDFNKMLQKMREKGKTEPKARDKFKEGTENEICERVEVIPVEIITDENPQLVSTKVLFIEQPYVYIGFRPKDDADWEKFKTDCGIDSDDELHQFQYNICQSLSGSVSFVPEDLTKIQFIQLTGLCNIEMDWGEKRTIYDKIAYFTVQNGDDIDFTYFEMVIQLVGYGALRVGELQREVGTGKL